MNGKPDTGSPQFTSKVPNVPSEGCSSPKIKHPGGVPPVSGDSAGRPDTTKAATASPGSCRDGSPNNGANPQQPVQGGERTPITS